MTNKHLLEKIDDQTVGSDDTQEWLVTYADTITLLMSFFVILLSISVIDSAKYEALKSEVSKFFGMQHVLKQEMVVISKEELAKLINPDFDNLTKELKKIIEKENLTGKVEVQETSTGVTVSFLDELAFDEAKAIIKPEAYKFLDKTSAILNNMAKKYTFSIEGHTDNSKLIDTRLYRSNWELSFARALNVLKYFKRNGIDINRLSATGYADTRPTAPNNTPLGKKRNRRVEIKISK